MIMYHGTAERHLAAILREGIKPRGKTRKSNWKHTVESNPKAVYMTTTYGMHFATCACNKGERMAILEIETDLLNPWLFAPDEDFLEQVSRNQEVTDHLGNECPTWNKDDTGRGNMKERTMWYRKRALSSFHHMWEKSTEYMGTCCYYGVIPPSAILRTALVPNDGHLSWMSDPTITPLNFRIMGDYYKQLMRHVFGDEVVTDENDHLNRIGKLREVPRDGVVVETVASQR